MNHLLIALEGLDGSGKTTLAKRLNVQFWPDILLTREPTIDLRREPTIDLRTPASADPHELALLYAADRRAHQPEIAAGMAYGLMICDRYSLSMRAYQHASGCDLDWLAELDRGCLVPDLTIYLDVPVEVAMARLAGRPGLNHDLARLTAVKAAYGRVIDHARAGGWRIEVVDGTGTEAEVFDRVWALLVGMT